jgi:TonB family protein
VKACWFCLTLLLVASPAIARSSKARSGDASKETTIDVTALSKAPKLTKLAKAEYPPQAVGKSDEVAVSLLVDLDEKGEVTGVSVLEPKTATGLGFEDAAVAAAYDLAFEPAEIDGKPVPVQVVYNFKFIPPKPAPEEAAPVATETKPEPKPEPVPQENFTGQLLERGTRTPMGGVLVTVYRGETGFENRTGAEGRFRFFNLDPGAWNVLIEQPAYYPYRTSEEMQPGLLTHATYFIERQSYSVFDKKVTAPRERKEVSRTIIDTATIDKVPGAMGDPMAVVQDFAGVARVQAGSGKLVVRGSAPQDTQIFVDGTRVPVMYHFMGLRSVLPLGMIDNLEFYPGNFSPAYGRGIGGIVDVGIKKLNPPRFGGYFDINLLDAGLYLEAPLTDKLSVAVSARRSYIDAVLGAVIPKDAPITNLSLPRYYDYQVLANYRPSAAHDLRFFFFGSDDSFAALLRNPANVGTEISSNQTSLATNFNRALLSYRYVPDERFENTLRLSYGRDKVNATLFQFYEHFTLDTITLRDTARYQWSKRLALSAGLDLMGVRVNGSASGPAPTRDGQEEGSVDYSKVQTTNLSGDNTFLPGAFVELEIRPTPKLLILPGLRLDYYSDIAQFTTAPRLTVRYELNHAVTLKGGVGLFYQEPAFDQINRDFGNPNLKAERALHYSAGVEWHPIEPLTVDVTGFYKSLSNMVSPTTATVERDGVSSEMRYDNHGAGRVYGGELVARYQTPKFNAWLAYTLSRSERRDSGSSDYRLFNYDQTHILTAFATYQFWHNWEFGGRFRLISGNPYTPVIGSIYNAGSDRYYPTLGSQYANRMPAFAQLDLRIDKRWVFKRWMLDTYVDVQNVLNRANPEAMQYNYDFSKQQVRQGLPIYPIFGVRGEF